MVSFDLYLVESRDFDFLVEALLASDRDHVRKGMIEIKQ
jgi:hypothetical protein